jgi:hypothetical protein
VEPSAEQIERAAAALLPFVSAWRLSLNPEDLDELAFAVLSHFDSTADFESIIRSVEDHLTEIRARREELNAAYQDAGKQLDGFSLQQRLDTGGHKMLARMGLRDIDMPWFICTFEPTHYFDGFREIFAEQERAIEAEDWAREELCAQALDRASVRLQRFQVEALPTSGFLMRIDSDGARVRYEPAPEAQLLSPARYANEQTVRVEARRGSRRASVFREHEIPESLTTRLSALGRAYDLKRVPSIVPHGQDELDQQAARELAHELDFLTRVSRDPLLEPHLKALLSVAEFCWQTDDPAWLTILGL